MSTDVNGTNLAEQPAAAQRPDGRAYCDTCRFANLMLSAAANGVVMACRRHPPQAVGNVVPTGGGNAQWFTQTVWPVVTRDDWCGAHEPDPRAASAARTSALIAGADSKAS